MPQRHSYARTDEEEDLAISIALAASLADGDAALSSAGRSRMEHPAAQHKTQQPSQQQQHHQQQPRPSTRPSLQQPHHHTPVTPPAPSRTPLWQRPLAALDTALQRAAAEAGGVACAACGRWLGAGAHVNALGAVYHPECFRCTGCGKSLAAGSGDGSTFAVGQDGQAYHAGCHRELFHPRCEVCAQHIPERAGAHSLIRHHTDTKLWSNSGV